MRIFSEEQTKSFLASLDRRSASAAVWVQLPDERMVILKSDYKRHWSLPGGFIDANETPLEAAIREVKEEIGIQLKPENVNFELAVDRQSSRLGHSYQFIFRTTIAESDYDQIVLQESEIEEMALVDKQQVLSGDRNYAEAIIAWANNVHGYAEHTIN